MTVVRRRMSSRDRFGNQAVYEEEREDVANVLVSPVSTSDLAAPRPNGDAEELQLHFPRGYGKSLRGCSVELPAPWGRTYRVVGDPVPYIDEDTPTPWNLPVKVEAAHG